MYTTATLPEKAVHLKIYKLEHCSRGNNGREKRRAHHDLATLLPQNSLEDIKIILKSPMALL